MSQAMAELYGYENFTVPRIRWVDAAPTQPLPTRALECASCVPNGTAHRCSHLSDRHQQRLEPWLVVCNPGDAARIARMHTKKARMYSPSFLGGGIFGIDPN
eukprot:SAG31_NODE_902_length_11133_cov_4.169386_5_plen_102_part_00